MSLADTSTESSKQTYWGKRLKLGRKSVMTLTHWPGKKEGGQLYIFDNKFYTKGFIESSKFGESEKQILWPNVLRNSYLIIKLLSKDAATG